MKKIIAIVVLFATTITAFSQSLAYNDLGILFSKDDLYGTSRFNAMSGAFGALGGDVSSIGINPAGGTIARKSSFSFTLGNRSTDLSTNYYGNTLNSQDDFFNVSQAGGILSYETGNSEWNRFAFTFNYHMKKDFDNSYNVKGNESLYAIFDRHLNDDSDNPAYLFDRSLKQSYSATESGQSSVMNIGFSAVHQNKLFVGASLNFHDVEYEKITLLNETNDNENGDILNVESKIKNTFQGNGFSLGLGFIYKLDQNIRLGLAYETPTWHQEIIETYKDVLKTGAIPDLDLFSETDVIDEDPNVFRFKSPGRVTASGAYIFGKQGLVSVDYTYRDYRNTKYRESDKAFLEANESFSNNYRGTHALNVGTEWRFDKMSIRAGASYEKDPNLVLGGSTNKDNIKSFSAGFGYNFGNTKVDLSYTNRENTEFRTLYNTGDIISDNNTSRITGTVSFNL